MAVKLFSLMRWESLGLLKSNHCPLLWVNLSLSGLSVWVDGHALAVSSSCCYHFMNWTSLYEAFQVWGINIVIANLSAVFLGLSSTFCSLIFSSKPLLLNPIKIHRCLSVFCDKVQMFKGYECLCEALSFFKFLCIFPLIFHPQSLFSASWDLVKLCFMP